MTISYLNDVRSFGGGVDCGHVATSYKTGGCTTGRYVCGGVRGLHGGD